MADKSVTHKAMTALKGFADKVRGREVTSVPAGQGRTPKVTSKDIPGTGMAKQAGKAIEGRKKRIDKAVKGK